MDTKPLSKKQIKDRINTELHALSLGYYSAIPLDLIFRCVEHWAGRVVDEDGTPWNGLLLGDDSHTSFAIEGRKLWLWLSWYKMPSGNYEIVAYVS